jgi:Sec-independent protein secretion pathway component TatC
MAVGIAFLFPIILNNLIHYKFIKMETLKKSRVLFALGLAFVIIIIPFLPNNPLEQLVVFLPIYSLYELTIFFNDIKWQGFAARFKRNKSVAVT